jgi:hypothetical protein
MNIIKYSTGIISGFGLILGICMYLKSKDIDIMFWENINEIEIEYIWNIIGNIIGNDNSNSKISEDVLFIMSSEIINSEPFGTYLRGN